MIIKKFEAPTEKDAMLMVQDELGKGAIIMNIKKISPRGLMRLFKKGKVEVTAAAEDSTDSRTAESPAPADPDKSRETAARVIEKALREEKEKRAKDRAASPAPSAIEEKLDNLADMLEKQISNGDDKTESGQDSAKKDEENGKLARIKKMLYDQFIDSEIAPEYARMFLDDITDIPDREDALNSILSNVYQRMVLKLGQPEVIDLDKGEKPRVCFFVGSTGVGKTTTIAKIASYFKIEKKAQVALVTSDTYRIAAVEQLKTYANILSIPIRVVYSPDEMEKAISDYERFDLILVDTAGRSPKNKKQVDDLSDLMKCVDEDHREVYLVVSATTKYRDLRQIVATYHDVSSYRLIFTKLDETDTYGNILNLRLDTGAPLSYVTVGQVVPDDIERLNPQLVTRKLIGGDQ